MTVEQIAEAAPYYEEYTCALNPNDPGVRQAKLLFDKLCRDAYALEPETYREKYPFEFYVPGVIVPAINRYLAQRSSPYPTIQPERQR